jgi:hypothetical protein
MIGTGADYDVGISKSTVEEWDQQVHPSAIAHPVSVY